MPAAIVARITRCDGSRIVAAATDEATLFGHCYPRMGRSYLRIDVPAIGEIWEPMHIVTVDSDDDAASCEGYHPEGFTCAEWSGTMPTSDSPSAICFLCHRCYMMAHEEMAAEGWVFSCI